MPTIQERQNLYENNDCLSIRIKFKDKAARRYLMLKATKTGEFAFRFEDFDSVIVSNNQAEKLSKLAQDAGASVIPVSHQNSAKAKSRSTPLTHEDRVEAWKNLMVKIDEELNLNPA